MHELFDADWHSLDLESVVRFLSDADTEPLLWEAKGDTLDKHYVRKTICGFANSVEGGYLILGASERDTGAWQPDGLPFPEDPPSWVSKVAHSGLRPRPDYDVRSWPIPDRDGKRLAVVRVEPIAAPPCVSRGTVYERVSGETIPVKDPLRLAELYQRGRQAHRNAQNNANEAALRLILGPSHAEHRHPEYPQVALGLAATAYTPDIASRLFTEGFANSIRTIIDSTLLAGHYSGPPLFTQQALQIGAHPPPDLTSGMTRGWVVRATWTGAVGIYYVWAEDELYHLDSYLPDVIERAWPAALELTKHLGGHGDFYVTIMVAGGRFPGNYTEECVGDLPIVQKGPFFEDPGVETQRRGIERELRRALGEGAWEPEPTSADPE